MPPKKKKKVLLYQSAPPPLSATESKYTSSNYSTPVDKTVKTITPSTIAKTDIGRSIHDNIVSFKRKEHKQKELIYKVFHYMFSLSGGSGVEDVLQTKIPDEHPLYGFVGNTSESSRQGTGNSHINKLLGMIIQHTVYPQPKSEISEEIDDLCNMFYITDFHHIAVLQNYYTMIVPTVVLSSNIDATLARQLSTVSWMAMFLTQLTGLFQCGILPVQFMFSQQEKNDFVVNALHLAVLQRAKITRPQKNMWDITTEQQLDYFIEQNTPFTILKQEILQFIEDVKLNGTHALVEMSDAVWEACANNEYGNYKIVYLQSIVPVKGKSTWFSKDIVTPPLNELKKIPDNKISLRYTIVAIDDKKLNSL